MSDTGAPSETTIPEPSSLGSELAPWRELVGQIGAEVAGPLSSAMERIHVLTGTGRIDRRGLRALRNEVETARQVGLLSQQIARLASGDMTQTLERLQLAQVMKGVLSQRVRDTESSGIQIRQSFQPVDVIVDAPMLFSLLNTLLEWSLANARSYVEFKIDIKTWPARARLTTHFAHRKNQPAGELAPTGGLDSLGWRLLQQTASGMGLPVARQIDDVHAELIIEFPRTIQAPVEDERRIDAESAPAPGSASALDTHIPPKPLVGSHVLVAAPRRDLRLQIRESVRHLGLIVDFVGSLAEASDFCRDGLPHALVYDESLAGPELEKLKALLRDEAPQFVFVKIVDGPGDASAREADDASLPRVSQQSILTSLPAVLSFELSNTM